ncbi:S-adenosyl-L-methionine-dependent methyltransferase, partial [Tricharina praecox]|uniref:S-adenosyl-L-methionine-dependent methyltransferase n=1 Tax=Tricharina praecox TaxID=43433 RepID=UPI00221FC99F
FAPGDRVLLRHTNNPEKVYLTQPLAAHKSAESHHGSIPHTDIIGRGPRDILATRRGTEFRLTWPTLDQYVTRVPRIVTPVYPLDAATIASLLDVHVDGGALAEGSAPLEIFEAGTGHGSLTLALARTDKARRGAVVHSLDISAKHSAHARDVVKGFRRGMYMDDIEFYVGDPSVWIRQQMKERGLEARDGEGEAEGFLYAVLLDLPGHDDHLAAAAEATLTDGIVGVFCPSITQVAACLKMVKTQRLPLVLSQVLEFPGGAGTGAGLRSWDVRYARVRSRSDKKLSISEAENKDDAGAVGEGEEGRESEYEMVCRPTSFERVIGGGFFGIFRRKA